MDNPGLRHHARDEYIQVVSRRKTASPPPMTTPQSLGDYGTPGNVDVTQKEDLETPPPHTGGPTSDSVGTDNGSYGADSALNQPGAMNPGSPGYRDLMGYRAGVGETMLSGTVRQHVNPTLKPAAQPLKAAPVQNETDPNELANQARIDREKEQGGGRTTQTYLDAQDRINQQMMLRRGHPLHQAAEGQRPDDEIDLGVHYYPQDRTPQVNNSKPCERCWLEHNIIEPQATHVAWNRGHAYKPMGLESGRRFSAQRFDYGSCPVCDAEVGEPCTSAKSNTWGQPVSRPHPEREKVPLSKKASAGDLSRQAPGRGGCETCWLNNGEHVEEEDHNGSDPLYTGEQDHSFKPFSRHPQERFSHHDPDQDLRDALDIQGSHGNWDYDEYMHGMFNGMEFARSVKDRDEPQYRKAPDHWGYEKTGAAEPESDEEFWNRAEREHPGEQSVTKPWTQFSPDIASQEFYDDPAAEDLDEDDLDIPENMSLRDHAKLLRSGVMRWDGDTRYPQYSHFIHRHVIDADGRPAYADEGHTIEHNTSHHGPVLPTEDNPDPHVNSYPWSHTYYPAGVPDGEGLTKGYNSVDSALGAVHRLAVRGPRDPASQDLLSGYRYVHNEQPYDPSIEFPHEAAMRSRD